VDRLLHALLWTDYCMLCCAVRLMKLADFIMSMLQVQFCCAAPPGSPGHVRCHGSTRKSQFPSGRHTEDPRDAIQLKIIKSCEQFLPSPTYANHAMSCLNEMLYVMLDGRNTAGQLLFAMPVPCTLQDPRMFLRDHKVVISRMCRPT
jgi:hypothetical protein